MDQEISLSEPMDPLPRSIRDPRKCHGGLAVWLCLGVFFSIPLAGSTPREKFDSVRPSFLRHPVIADVARGGTVTIPVEVIALPGEKVDLEIDSKPAFGTVLLRHGSSSESMSFLYKSDAAKKTSSDKFSFRFRAGSHAWSTHIALLRVIDHDAVVIASPSILDFGDLVSGSRSSLTLTLSNSAGKDAKGRILVPDPWKVEATDPMLIPEGEYRSYLITFAPDTPGDYASTLTLDSSCSNSPVVPLRGRCLSPFLVAEDRFEVFPEKSAISISVRNPSTSPRIIKVTGDRDLRFPEELSLTPLGESTLVIETSGVNVPVESSRIVHIRLQSEGLAKILEVIVRGREGKISADIPSMAQHLVTSGTDPVRLQARLKNESKGAMPFQWRVEGEDGTLVDVPDSGKDVLDGECVKDLTFLWKPLGTGLMHPKLLLDAKNYHQTLSWSVDCRAKRIDSIQNHSESAFQETSPVDSWTLRNASDDEKQKMVVLLQPVMVGAFYPRRLELRWTYLGSGRDGFVIEEHTAFLGISDRTGESEGGWKPVFPKIAEAPSPGSWKASFPVFFPGTREFRIRPGGNGERVMAITTIPLTPSMVYEPAGRILGITSLVLLSGILLRMVVNRRSDQSD